MFVWFVVFAVFAYDAMSFNHAYSGNQDCIEKIDYGKGQGSLQGC